MEKNHNDTVEDFNEYHAGVRENMEMRLNDLPFEQIRSGEKTVEIRLYDEKRREIREGDIIMFYRKDRSEWIRASVRALHRAPTFAQLFELPDMLEKAGFSGMSLSDAVGCMRRYYSSEQEKQYGVLGIELCDLRQ